MYLPHAVSVAAPAKGSVGGVPGTVGWASGVDLVDKYAQITPLSVDKAFDPEGNPVERAHLLLGPLADASVYVKSAKVVYGARTFYVVVPAKTWDALPGANFCEVMLQEDK